MADRWRFGQIEFAVIARYREPDMGFIERQKSVSGRSPHFPESGNWRNFRRIKPRLANGRSSRQMVSAQIIDEGNQFRSAVNYDHRDEWLGTDRSGRIGQSFRRQNVDVYWT